MKIISCLALPILLLVSGCIPWAISDVPVTNKICWAGPIQGDVYVTDFKVETVGDTDFGLFGTNRALVRMHIAGTLYDDRGLLPFVGKVQIGQFFEPPTNDSPVTAEVVATPIPDEHWFKKPLPSDVHGGDHIGPIPFDLKVETVVETYQYGSNPFVFRCGKFVRRINLNQGT